VTKLFECECCLFKSQCQNRTLGWQSGGYDDDYDVHVFTSLDRK